MKPILALAVLCLAAACQRTPSPNHFSEEALIRIGSVTVTPADLEHHLQTHFDGRNDEPAREQALKVLGRRAQLEQAAIDAGLNHDPAVRAEVSRILAGSFKEREQASLPAAIPEDRLRELFADQASQLSLIHI